MYPKKKKILLWPGDSAGWNFMLYTKGLLV